VTEMTPTTARTSASTAATQCPQLISPTTYVRVAMAEIIPVRGIGGRRSLARRRSRVRSPAVRLGLVPRTTEFYELFASAGANALDAARKSEQRFREYPNSNVAQADVKAVETTGDRITHDIIQLLNTQYVTPFDREDIYELATAIDDVVDLIEEASDLIELYGIESATRYAVQQCGIIVSATECLNRALAGLKAPRTIQPLLVELKGYEDEGDRVARDAIAALFHDPRIDPLVVIRWKDVYEALEGALDACETAANVVGNIVVKNA
jgi:uncharacterized protein